MTSIKYSKKRVMQYAWTLYKKQGVSDFAAALRASWCSEKWHALQRVISGQPEPVASKSLMEVKNESFMQGCLDYYAEKRNGGYSGD